MIIKIYKALRTAKHVVDTVASVVEIVKNTKDKR